MLTGKDLLDLGLKPNKRFGEALAHINDNHLTGAALSAYLDTMRPRPPLPLLAEPVPGV